MKRNGLAVSVETRFEEGSTIMDGTTVIAATLDVQSAGRNMPFKWPDPKGMKKWEKTLWAKCIKKSIQARMITERLTEEQARLVRGTRYYSQLKELGWLD